MAERLLSVKVRADVADFLRGAGLVEDATRKMGDSAKRAGDESKKGLGGVAQSMRDNRQAWSQVGGALTTYGAAVAGVATAVAATGISYNQLRQTSVAALTTMTGSAEAANRQMDRLDDFASNSPFARDVFIRAQQQLIGFGFEAERVVPILDAIQNAVAATGGSNHDIAELTRIIAQVGAAGKITAQDLNQFGQRGVDAATLIGDQMGMTGAQIREEITSGTLDAGAALDALVLGMEESYGGAADNVKATFAGATDRVKAAWRDLSSTLMEPLVSQHGGGFLHDATNGLADFMRSVERAPDGLLQLAGGLTALSGAASLAVGGFFLLAPRIVDTRDAVRVLRDDFPRLDRAMGATGGAARKLIPVLGVAGLLGAIAAIGHSMRDFDRDAAVMEQAVLRLADTGDAFSAAFGDDSRYEIERTREELQRTLDAPWWDKPLAPLEWLAVGMGKVFNQDWRDFMTRQTDDLRDWGEGLAGIAQRDLPTATEAFAAWGEQMGLSSEQLTEALDAMPAYADALRNMATEAGIALEPSDLLRLALGEITIEALAAEQGIAGIGGPDPAAAEGMGELGDEVKSAAEEAEEAQKAFDNLKDSISSLGDALLGVRGSARDYEAQLDRIKTAMKDDEWKRTLDITTEAGRENQAMLDGLASSTTGYASSALEAGAGMGQVSLILQRGREDFIATAEAMGMTAEDAATLADNLGLIPDNVEMMFRAAGLDELIVEANGVVDFASSLEALINLGIEPIAAETMLTDFLRVADSSTATVALDADDAEAQRIRQGLIDDIDESAGTVGVWADDSQAQATRRGTIIDINDSDGTVTIYGNGGEALRTADDTVWSINQKSATISVYAQVRTTAAAITSQVRRLGGLIPGFESGGYTGDGDPKQIAGVTHGREFVSTASTVADSANRAALEYMHAGGSMRTLVEQSAASYSPQWTSQVAASYAAAPVMQAASGPATAVLAPEDRALLQAVAARPVRLEADGRVMAQVVEQGKASLGGRLNTGGNR